MSSKQRHVRRFHFSAIVGPVFSVLLAVVSLSSFAQLRAEEESFWTSPKNPSLEVVRDFFVPAPNEGQYCNHEHITYRIREKITWNTSRYVDHTEERCLSVAAYGKVGVDFLQFKNDPNGYRLDLRGLPKHVPNAESLFYTTNAPNSYSHDLLHAIDNPIASFEKRSGYNGLEYQYFVKDDAVRRTLNHPKTGDPLRVNAFDASANGEWLITETTQGFARVNPSNFDDKLIFGSTGGYGVGSDPSLDLAISNDGRYAAVAGHFNQITVYDLSTCVQPNSESDNIKATGCGKKELAEYILSQDSNYKGAHHLRFSDDGSQLSMTVHMGSGQPIKKVTLSAMEQTQLDYLATGDSYASGEGDMQGSLYYEPGTDGELDPNEKCHISTRSYPYILARQMGLMEPEFRSQFRSVACSGAKVSDVTSDSDEYVGHFEQYKDWVPRDRRTPKAEAVDAFIPGRAAQIEFVEKYQPKALTISIGGNDADFGNKVKECLSTLDTCKYASSELPGEGVEIKGLFEDLKGTYDLLHDKSELTKIYVTGYPRFVNSEVEICPSLNVLLDKTERKYIDEGTMYINDVIEAAARAAGVTYIDIENALSGKELCSAPQPFVNANGVRWGEEFDFPFINIKAFGQESYHPTNDGHAAIAQTISAQIANLMEHEPGCVPYRYPLCIDASAEAPGIPGYFGTVQPGYVKKKLYDFTDSVVNKADEAVDATVEFLKSGSSFEYKWKSTPIPAGTYTADANGELNVTLDIPEELEPGYHTLHGEGISPSGEPVHLYQHVLVIASEQDIDGDGIPNSDDQCLFIQSSGVDQDRDTLDDACDPFIAEAPLPAAPTVTMPEFINIANKNAVTISGEGEADTTAHISVDDNNPETDPVTAKTDLAKAEPGNAETPKTFTYSKELDLSSLDDGNLTATVKLKNERGESEVTTTTAAKDTQLPETQTTISPEVNEVGWYKSDVTVQLTAEDGGTGLQKLTYHTTGAHNIPETTVEATPEAGNVTTTSLTIPVEGETTLHYYATDKAGNAEEATTLTIRIDTTAPATVIDQRDYAVIIGLLGGRLSGAARDKLSGIGTTDVMFTNVVTGTQHTLESVCKTSCSQPAANTTWEVRPRGLAMGLYRVMALSVDRAGNRGVASGHKVIIVFNL